MFFQIPCYIWVCSRPPLLTSESDFIGIFSSIESKTNQISSFSSSSSFAWKGSTISISTTHDWQSVCKLQFLYFECNVNNVVNFLKSMGVVEIRFHFRLLLAHHLWISCWKRLSPSLQPAFKIMLISLGNYRFGSDGPSGGRWHWDFRWRD